MTRSLQQSRGYTGKEETQGLFATAWYDHGTNPQNDYFYYIILPSKGQEYLNSYNPDAIAIVQHGEDGIIVHHKELQMTGYALPKNDTIIHKGIIKQVSKPCLVMTKTNFDEQAEAHINITVVDPDLGWGEPGTRYAIRRLKEKYHSTPTEPIVTQITLILDGIYSLTKDFHNVTLETSFEWDTTTIQVMTFDGLVSYFELTCESLESCTEVHISNEVLY